MLYFLCFAAGVACAIVLNDAIQADKKRKLLKKNIEFWDIFEQ